MIIIFSWRVFNYIRKNKLSACLFGLFTNPCISRHDFENLSQRVKRALELQGYTVELKNTYQDAFRASLRFPRLLYDSGISGHRDEKLLIRIDTEPQEVQYNPDKFILNKFDVFSRINIVPADILAAPYLDIPNDLISD